jgi:hypothetical protein
VNAPPARLADYIKANDGHPAGNATLVIRNQADANGQVTGGGADLYTDSGAYYWAPFGEVCSERGPGQGAAPGPQDAAPHVATPGDPAAAVRRLHHLPGLPGDAVRRRRWQVLNHYIHARRTGC